MAVAHDQRVSSYLFDEGAKANMGQSEAEGRHAETVGGSYKGLQAQPSASSSQVCTLESAAEAAQSATSAHRPTQSSDSDTDTEAASARWPTRSHRYAAPPSLAAEMRNLAKLVQSLQEDAMRSASRVLAAELEAERFKHLLGGLWGSLNQHASKTLQVIGGLERATSDIADISAELVPENLVSCITSGDVMVQLKAEMDAVRSEVLAHTSTLRASLQEMP